MFLYKTNLIELFVSLRYICLKFIYIDCLFFFCKQKTAYEMRISDWSSDVCSSDLHDMAPGGDRHVQYVPGDAAAAADQLDDHIGIRTRGHFRRVVVPAIGGQIDAPVAPRVARRNGRHDQRSTATRGQQVRLPGQQLKRPAADGTEPGDCDLERLAHGDRKSTRLNSSH